LLARFDRSPTGGLEDLVRRLEKLGAASRSPDEEGDGSAPRERSIQTADAERLILACRDVGEQVSEALTLQYFSHVYDTPHATVNA